MRVRARLYRLHASEGEGRTQKTARTEDPSFSAFPSLIACTWQNTSSPGWSGLMKPKPFSSFQLTTTPVSNPESAPPLGLRLLLPFGLRRLSSLGLLDLLLGLRLPDLVRRGLRDFDLDLPIFQILVDQDQSSGLISRSFFLFFRATS